MRNIWSLPYSAVTPKSEYLNRRRFLSTAGAAGAVAAGSLLLPATASATTALQFAKTGWGQGEKLTTKQIITIYNNYYEFGTDKDEHYRYADKLQTSGWTIKFEGDYANQKTIDLE